MLSHRAAGHSLQSLRAFHLQQLPLSRTLPRVHLLPLAARTRLLFTHPPDPLTTFRCRANHTLSLPKLADRSGAQGLGAPPTPPSSLSATKFRHNNSLLLSQSSKSPASGLSTNYTKIASQRSAQIARHLSSSASEPASTMASEYSVRKVAAPNTLEHRVYIEKDGVPVSAFHDVPLYADQEKGILNMIVEIPRWSNAKLEVRRSILSAI